MAESIETIIVGGGQAGLSTSYFLTQAGREHLVLEKGAVPGSAWQDERWDSFTLVTPNWSFRLPDGAYDGPDPAGYMGRAEIARRFADYAARQRLPVQYNTPVRSVRARDGGGYTVQTAAGDYHARNVVVANGFLREGRRPEFSGAISPALPQLHSSAYRSPAALPPGAVLVVGSGQSGMQIAEELYQAGRKVFLATGGAPAGPRRYRGKDLFEWLFLSGFFDMSFPEFQAAGLRRFVPPQLTGKNGGHALNLHQFARDGVILLGHVIGADGDRLRLAEDLHDNLRASETGRQNLLQRVDGFITRSGLDAPAETLPVETDAFQAQERASLDLRAEGVSSIVWACGYRYDAALVGLDVLNEMGLPATQRGVTRYPGLYFAGIPFQNGLKSAFLFGSAADASYIAEQITGQG